MMKRVRLSQAMTLLVFPLLAGSTLPSTPACAAPQKAASADRFVDSIGIGGGAPRTPEGNKVYREKAMPRILELGVRAIRTDVDTHNESSEQIYRDLGKQGIKTMAIIDPRGVQWGTAHTPEQAIAMLKRVGPQNMIVEGPNEPDLINPNYLFVYNGKAITAHPEIIRDYMRDLYTALKNDPATKNVTVVQASIGAAPKGGEDIWKYCDVIAAHWYGPGAAPGWRVNWEAARRQMRDTDKPIWVTETGDHTAVYKSDGLWQPGIPEDVQAKNTARIPFYYFSQGIPRTFIHQLFSGDDLFYSQAQFGILRGDYSPKPAFNALRDIITLMKDPGPAHEAKPLDYTLTGDQTNMMQLLLQKRDGRHYLVLWQNVNSFNPQTLSMLNNPTKRITVSITAPTAGANLYAPTTNGTVATGTRQGKTFTVEVPDHPLIIELVSKAGQLAKTTRPLLAQVPGALPPQAPMGVRALRPIAGNEIANHGFEIGALQPWNDYGTESKIVGQPVFSGTKAVQIGDGDGKGGVNIGVALKPNTEYLLRAHTMLSKTGEQARLTVAPRGMPEKTGHFTHTIWAPVTVEFTTGADGSAQIYFWKDAGEGSAFGDNFILTTPDKLSGVEAIIKAQELKPVGLNATTTAK